MEDIMQLYASRPDIQNLRLYKHYIAYIIL